MATTAHRIKDKIKVPFLEQLSNLNPSQKLAIIAFLAGSMQDNIQDKPKHNTIFKNYKSADEITDEDRRKLAEKIKGINISPSVNELIDNLSLSKEEIEDERTRYILGKK